MRTTPHFGNEAQLFEGRYIDVMPALLKAGLNPVSPALMMDKRNESSDPKNELWTNYWDTDFGLAADSENVYLFPHSKQLRKLTPKTKLKDHGIVLKTVKGARALKRNDLILNERLTEKQAREHPGWLELADGNQARLDIYVENTFRLGNEYKFDKMMALYVPQDKKPIERALVLGRLSGRSFADGERDLGDDFARLVGGTWKVCEADEKTLDNLAVRVLKEMKSGKQIVQLGSNVYILAPKGIEVKR